MTPAQLLDKALIVKELRRLAALPALKPRSAELSVLHQDLGGSNQLDRWAEIDLVQAYVRPESVRAPLDRSSGRHDRLLEAALGVLVFIPLLITWFGLREAVRAYGELADENPEQATRPFLQLWQSGFGGHLSSLGRFENVALMAVLLIALLVGLSVWHARVRVRTERAEDAREAEQDRLLAELAAVLTRTQMLLASHRSASPQQFTAQLTAAAQKMQQVTIKAERSHNALTGATASAVQAADALRLAAQSLTKEVPKLGDAADRINTTLRNGTEETAKAGRANAQAARGIVDHVKTAGDTVEASLKALVAAQQSLVTKSESVAKATELASQALVTSAGRTGDAVDGMREATERWDAAAAHWQDAAARLDARMAALARTLPMSAATPTSGGYGSANGAYGAGSAATNGGYGTGRDPANGPYGSGGDTATGGYDTSGAHRTGTGPATGTYDRGRSAAGGYGTGGGSANEAYAMSGDSGTGGRTPHAASAHAPAATPPESAAAPGPVSAAPPDAPLDPPADAPLDAPTTRLPPPRPRSGGNA
ncbi:hypothetical protein ABZ819_32715 [Streptomyces venezuelae]|uniref:hypothetical protein n=1 Tax=Streptomyces venezuelae TaxID=54571 RepID=UPI0034408DF7